MLHLILMAIILAIFTAQVATMDDHPRISIALFVTNLLIILVGLIL